MAKTVRHLRPRQDEFQKIFAKLCNTKSAWQAWSDFVEMIAIAISNSCDPRDEVKQERETAYLNIIGTYKEAEQKIFHELLGVLVFALEENPEQDFLGEMFMALELGSHWHGQFFTPYNICTFMAQISIGAAKEKVRERGYVTVNDCACGAGATLIGARNQLQKAGFGGTEAFFVGQDISRTAGLMCYIQLSLLGCAGYVVIADSLLYPVTGPMLWPNLMPEQEAWFMPMNFHEPIWRIRHMAEMLPHKEPAEDVSCQVQATCSQGVAKEAPPIVEIPPPPETEPEPIPEPEPMVIENHGGQLSLF